MTGCNGDYVGGLGQIRERNKENEVLREGSKIYTK